MILQSSSVTVGIIMALASQGLLNFANGTALVLGTEIGTTITAQIAALGANINAHRTATFHTFINVTGVLLIALIFPFFIRLVAWVTSLVIGMGPPDLLLDEAKPNIARHIANFQTMFNIITAVFFLMVLPYVVKAAIWLTPNKKGENELDELHHIKYIDFKYIEVPSMALTQARAEINRMGEAVNIMYNDVIRSLRERKLTELLKWKSREEALDILQREITHFLVRTMQGQISDQESKDVRSLIRMVNNLERIGDATEEIATLIEELVEHNLYMSEEAVKDYEKISDESRQFLTLIMEKMKNENNEIMGRAREFVVNIHIMVEDMKGSHLLRLQRGVCEVDTGLIFVNILTSFEKMGGYCYNIAEAIAGLK
jgi:phosphate:Na+ symporter